MNGLHRLDIKQLRVLNSLIELQSLSQVAKKMGLTQQAISEQLRKLRDTFEDHLFIRQGNKMVPTTKALSLQVPILEVLSKLEDILAPEEFSPSKFEGIFTISATDYAIHALLPRLMNKLRTEAPGLKIIVRDFESDNVNELLSSGEIDLLISFPEFVPESLPYKKLFDEQHICIASRCSKLLKKNTTIKDISSSPQVIVSPSRANLRGSLEQWFNSFGLTRNIIMSVPSFSSVPEILYATDMVAFYPSRLLPNEKVGIIELGELPPTFEVIVGWHQRTGKSKIHQWMIKQLECLCSEHNPIGDDEGKLHRY
jgi:DNA-binding transcriptional LysR family regulator|tara:strand:+ start:3352 stop:4287 length:936 start_codon:yes stop_codon:yes gene_type:complete